ncbi:MAG TPA: DUF2723 domain-containing protein, partial [Chthoniobacterales bacterium]|nr:DUF2723 domain-containing protein [Chthoniobacterales bacterium]
PPGFPLYVLLAHLATLLPLGNVAVRVHLVSALFGALAAGILTMVLAELLGTTSTPPAAKRHAQKKKRGKPDAPADQRDGTTRVRLRVLLPAAVAGLLLAFSRTLWSYATIAEVYTLNTFLILAIVFLMLRWRERGDDRLLYGAALLFGLALGVHHVTVALILPALAVFVYRTAGLRFFASKQLLVAALVSFGALVLVYSYLPVAAARDPLFNWGDPRSLREVWWHITGRQYQAFFSFSPAKVGQQLLEFGALVLRQWSWPWLPLVPALALAGAVRAFRRERTVFWLIALLLLTDVAYAVGYDIAEDKDAYYLPAFVALTIAAGLGFRWLLQLRLPRVAVPLVASVLCAIAILSNWPFNNRRHYFVASDYVENIQRTIAPNGLLLTYDWQVQAPMLYTREIEQRRRDIKVIDVNLLRRSWYFDYLERAFPGLLARSGEKVVRFVTELQLWEQNPQAYAKNARLTQRIDNAFHELLQSLVREESKIGSVYATWDAVFLTDASDRKFTTWLMQNYDGVPRGLVFQFMTERGFHDPGEVHLETRGLADRTLRFDRGDVVRAKVLPAYTQMLLQSGRYLAFFNQHERAIAAFERALALDPHLKPAQEALAASRKKLGRSDETR